MANKNFDNANDQRIHDALNIAYDALKEKGYNAISQLTGYIFSDDGSYITTYKNARQGLQELDRDEMLQHILRNYFEG